MKLLSGPTLEQEISQRRQQARHWSARELEEIFDPILDGLAFAHGRGIMHRDIKPSNVLLSRAASGKLEPKLVDFGTARTQLSVFEPSIGKTGFTPMYGAPEQWDKSIGPPSPATDVYALGLTLLECASLQRPHGSADSLPAIMRALMGGGEGVVSRRCARICRRRSREWWSERWRCSRRNVFVMRPSCARRCVMRCRARAQWLGRRRRRQG